jgi:dienelactone hydrolase
MVVALSCVVLALGLAGCQKKPKDDGAGQGQQSKAAGMSMDVTQGMGGPGAMRARPVPAAQGSEPISEKKGLVRLEKYLGHMQKKEYAQAVAMFAPKMKEAMGEAKLKVFWEQLLVRLGAYQSYAVTKSASLKNMRRFSVRVTFAKGPLNLHVVFLPGGQVTGLFRRPDKPEYPPWKPPPYAKADQVREIPFTVGSGPLALPGILTVPTARGGKRYPAVVLVHGSGPQDKDETMGPNKIFKDIAWGLAARGIAVLRYDKVTKAHPVQAVAMLSKGFTMDSETTNDALKAAAQLRKHTLVQPAQVFFLGHSQGAMAAPRAGKRDPNLAGLILLAGPTRDFGDVGLSQLRYIVSLGGPQAKATRVMLPSYIKGLALVKSTKLTPKTPAKDLPFGIPATFWLDLRTYKPHLVAKTLKMPVLVLQGEADYQVTMVDFAGWKKALEGKPNATYKSYPRLGHHFIDLKKKLAVPMDYLQVTGHVHKPVIDDIAAFIQKRR